MNDDQRYAEFGKGVWKFITETYDEDFCGDVISEDILPIAQRCGLCERVPYAPEIHGDDVELEPGDIIWWWGGKKS